MALKTSLQENLSERRPRRVPFALKLAYGIATPVIDAVYARSDGPKNFLWLSDIALGLTTAAIITESRLPASIAAVGVLPLEIAWNADFVAGGRLVGLAAYMFDRRALPIQCVLTSALLPLTYAITDPKDNINWVFGPGRRAQGRVPPILYLGLATLAWPALVHWPTHRVLSRLFGTEPQATNRRRGRKMASSSSPISEPRNRPTSP